MALIQNPCNRLTQTTTPQTLRKTNQMEKPFLAGTQSKIVFFSISSTLIVGIASLARVWVGEDLALLSVAILSALIGIISSYKILESDNSLLSFGINFETSSKSIIDMREAFKTLRVQQKNLKMGIESLRNATKYLSQSSLPELEDAISDSAGGCQRRCTDILNAANTFSGELAEVDNHTNNIERDSIGLPQYYKVEILIRQFLSNPSSTENLNRMSSSLQMISEALEKQKSTILNLIKKYKETQFQRWFSDSEALIDDLSSNQTCQASNCTEVRRRALRVLKDGIAAQDKTAALDRAAESVMVALTQTLSSISLASNNCRTAS